MVQKAITAAMGVFRAIQKLPESNRESSGVFVRDFTFNDSSLPVAGSASNEGSVDESVKALPQPICCQSGQLIDWHDATKQIRKNV